MYNLQIRLKILHHCRNFHLNTVRNKVIPFNLFDMGDGINQVIIKEWLVKEGDKISKFEDICKIQRREASVYVTSKYYGIIKKLYYNINDIALVGKPLIDIDEIVDISFPSKFEDSTQTTTKKLITHILSDVGDKMKEVLVTKWFVKEGDKVLEFDNICEIQTDKLNITITSKHEGIIRKIYYKVNSKALIGKPLIDYEVLVKNKSKPAKIISSINQELVSIFDKFPKVIALPTVRRSVRHSAEDLTNVVKKKKGTKVLNNDFVAHMKTVQSSEFTDIRTAQESVNISPEFNSNQEIQPLPENTNTIIQSLTESLKIPQIVYYNEMRVSSLLRLRRKLKTQNVNLTFLSFFIKAVSNSLCAQPILNSSLDPFKTNIIFHKSHNISITMDSPNGLVVPVIKEVNNKNIKEISKDVQRLVTRARQGKLINEDISHGTFTISNAGAKGCTYVKPDILPPQSAILIVGALKDMPLYSKKGQLKKETICFVSAAADRRIVKDKAMKNFCNVLKKHIEDPDLLLLNM